MYQGRFHGGDGAAPRRSPRRLSTGTIIFYVLYFLLIVAFLLALTWGLGALKNWLRTFEASQSTQKSQQVFTELFGDPDWAALYARTGQEDTLYEGAEAYSRYMTQLVGDRKLTMSQTSAGLDSRKEKYLVKLDKTVVADFTLVNSAPADERIPQWELDSLNIYYTRTRSVQVAVAPGYTVYINGVPLDDSHIVSITTTLAEKYLPDGLHGYRHQVFRLDGLLATPTVSVRNADGQETELELDEQTNTYIQHIPEQVPSQEIRDLAITAGQMLSRYMLADINRTGMQTCFDPNGEAYRNLPPTWELWVQDNRGFTFGETELSDFYAYSDSLYSIRVNVTVTVTRLDYTQKDYIMDTTFLFHQVSDGRWLVDQKTNEELQTRLTQVKLTYHVADAEPISQFVDSASSQLTLPEIPVPDGKTFLGWYTREIDANGKITMHLAFSPTEDGTVFLPEGTQLQAMELYPQFK